MAHLKMGDALSLAHAKVVVRAHQAADAGTSTYDLTACEYGHTECASTLCPCCFDQACGVIEREGSDEDLQRFDLKRRED